MKIGCWEVPKPTDPSLLWPAEWKAPAPLSRIMLFNTWKYISELVLKVRRQAWESFSGRICLTGEWKRINGLLMALSRQSPVAVPDMGYKGFYVWPLPSHQGTSDYESTILSSGSIFVLLKDKSILPRCKMAKLLKRSNLVTNMHHRKRRKKC